MSWLATLPGSSRPDWASVLSIGVGRAADHRAEAVDGAAVRLVHAAQSDGVFGCDLDADAERAAIRLFAGLVGVHDVLEVFNRVVGIVYPDEVRKRFALAGRVKLGVVHDIDKHILRAGRGTGSSRGRAVLEPDEAVRNGCLENLVERLDDGEGCPVAGLAIDGADGLAGKRDRVRYRFLPVEGIRSRRRVGIGCEVRA